MRRHLFGGAFAGAVALTATIGAAQQPQAQPPAPRTPATQEQPRAQEPARTVTVEGCVMREADVPGRRPNVAERAGIAEDYILTSTRVIKGSAPAATAPARPGDTPTGTGGTRAAMYEIEGIDDQQLKEHAGQRVQIDGTFENIDRAKANPERTTPADDLVEIRGTAIRKVAGACPAK
jgi:hypothetical protein